MALLCIHNDILSSPKLNPERAITGRVVKL